MDILLIGTNHLLQFDNPPVMCPTNKWGEAQKLLHQFWLRKLIRDFDPTIVFDESYPALTTFGLVHTENDFFRHTSYVPIEFPWVYMDVPMSFRQVARLRGLPYAADREYTGFLREEYWLQTISWIADNTGAKRIAIICGFLHVRGRGLEEKLRAAGRVETRDVHDQHWYNLEWIRQPNDQSIVDAWVEEHAKKRRRLGMK